MRRCIVDGYAVFAGGQSYRDGDPDRSLRARVRRGRRRDALARAFAGLLGAGIPAAEISEQSVGHDLSPAHFIQAS